LLDKENKHILIEYNKGPVQTIRFRNSLYNMIEFKWTYMIWI